MGAPAWQVDALANPTAAPGSQVTFIIRAANIGDEVVPPTAAGDADNCVPGAPPPSVGANCMTLSARFPDALTPVNAESEGFPMCSIDAGSNSVVCRAPGDTSDQQIAPQSKRSMTVMVDVNPAASGHLTSTFEIAGGFETAPGIPGRDTVVDAIEITDEPPSFGVASFDGQVSGSPAGEAFTQAGGHPYAASTAIEFNAITHPNPLINILFPVGSAKSMFVDLPPGFVADPTSLDQCSLAQLANTENNIAPRPLCAPASQIGVATIKTPNNAGSIMGPVPVFNMVPPVDAPARLGFNLFGTVVTLDAEVRSESDYGVTAVITVPQGLALQASELTLWGVPSDTSHDRERACAGEAAPSEGGPTCSSGAAPARFWRNPTTCTPDGVGLPTTLRVDSWENPGVFERATFESHLPPGFPHAPEDWGRPQGTTGCDKVPFRPTLDAGPGAGARAGAPSGFSFDLNLPQTDAPDQIGTADLRRAVVTLPRGVRLSPSSSDGLAGCSLAQIRLDSREAPICPPASKIGSLTITTPLLPEPLEGGVYLATPFDNPFDSLLAIYLVARGPGLVIKLPGHVAPDGSRGGQLTTTFDDNPQLPFSNLHLEFKGGPRAPLALPRRCGTYTTQAELTGWNGASVATSSSFTIDQSCADGFTPGFDAGTSSNRAGANSSFLLRMTRDDEDQELRTLSVDLPAGLTGRIASATLCPEANAAVGTCSEGSRIGDVTVGAGAGSDPFFITNGRAYLTGPYRGAPFGLSIAVPAVAGPFDLGTVVVRSQIFVDKHTAELRVVSEPLPTILQGIPLDVRDVRVNIDRPGFFLNPTSCAEKTIRGQITSTEGATANVSSRFQAADCAALPLRPRMTLRVGGRGRTQRGRTTPFTATLRQTPGQAALRFVRVTLPTTINARLTVINDACTRAQYEAGRCEDARTGSAVAATPLLRDPLRGGVYFVRNGRPLPDLFVRLRGQVDFDLIGRITIPGSKRLRTTFATVPDVPVSMFSLRLNGGRRGSIGNAANLCSRRGRRARAELDFRGQNGKVLQVDQRLKIRGCRARAGRRARRGRRR